MLLREQTITGCMCHADYGHLIVLNEQSCACVQIIVIVVIPRCTELYLQNYERAMVESGIPYNETLIFDISSLESEVNDACR